MTLVIAMLVLSSVFMYVMAHSLIQGHNSIAFEFSIKAKLANLYSQSEDEQVEKYGKAHVIVMGLADALSNEDKTAQFRQTQVIFTQARNYQRVTQNLPVDLPSFNTKPKLKAVK